MDSINGWQVVAAAVFISALLYSAWITSKFLRMIEWQRTSERDSYMKVIQSTQTALDLATQKVLARTLTEYGEKAKSPTPAKRIQFSENENELVPGGPNGEMIGDPETQAAIEMMSIYGITFSEAKEYVRKGAAPADPSIPGNTPME